MEIEKVIKVLYNTTDLVGAGNSKKTRVALYNETSKDRFTIVRDATFNHA